MKRLFATLFLVLLAVTCDEPTAIAVCDGTAAIRTFRDYPSERDVSNHICFNEIGEGAAYSVESSDPVVATTAVKGRMIVVTGGENGSAEASVTATGSGGSATAIFPIVTMDAAVGSFTCQIDSVVDEWTYHSDEGNYTAHVDLAELHGRLTLDNGESFDYYPLDVDVKEGTYQRFGSGQTRTTGASECTLEITGWAYAMEDDEVSAGGGQSGT